MLNTIPVFAGLGDKQLATIEQHMVSRTYPKNTIIVNEGDQSDSMYVIKSGKVKVFCSDEDGKEVILNEQGPGEYFGELSLIDDMERSASVMTTEKSTLMIFSKADFKKILKEEPEIALTLLRDLTMRVRALTENVRNLALLDVYGRVAKTLLNKAEEKDGEYVIEGKLTQQDIANRVGASREMVARIMKDLSVGGYITNESKRIVIHGKLPANY